MIAGANASGKTNILEALSLLSTAKSFRARIDEEMIHYESDIGRVKGALEAASETLEAILTRGVLTEGKVAKKVARKRLLLDGVGKRMVDFAGNFPTVLFRPQDLELVTDAPSRRRRFLDQLLSQVDYEYRRALVSYEKGIRRRNKLLLAIREEGAPRSQLYFWDELLIKNGNYIGKMRDEFIRFANRREALDQRIFSLSYDKSAISHERLSEYATQEVAAATTLVGPHRDDMIFYLEKEGSERDLGAFGSRGEQRMGVLWLKLAELAYISKDNTHPTLLLDDIFSELDEQHRRIVKEVAGNQQTIITTADEDYLTGFEKVEIIKL